MDFKDIVNIIFKFKNKYNTVTDEDKEKNFFIFNRFMSKKYPIQALALNSKFDDKVIAMDIWYMYLRNEYNVPDWFWRGKRKVESKEVIKDDSLIKFYELTEMDSKMLYYLFKDTYIMHDKYIKNRNNEKDTDTDTDTENEDSDNESKSISKNKNKKTKPKK